MRFKIVFILMMTLVLNGCGSNMHSGIGGVMNGPQLSSQMDTGGERAFVFDPNLKVWAAYDANGERVRMGKASGGADFCPDIGEPCRTVEGVYRVHTKRGEDCVSNTFPVGEGGAWMPHCMFFHRGFAIHGSGQVPEQNSSHGCIRVLPDAAKWLHEEFMDIGTKVIVRPYNT